MKHLTLYFAFTLVACSAPKRKTYDQAEFDRLSRLQRGLEFTERDRHGAEYPITSFPASKSPPKKVARLADGATLDVNSQLDMNVLEALTPASPRGGIVAETEAKSLAAKAGKLIRALDGLAEFRELETDTIRSWKELESSRSGDTEKAKYARFKQFEKRLVGAENLVLGPAMLLWPLSDPDHTKVGDMVSSALDGDADATKNFAARVQQKLDELSVAMKDFEARTRLRAEEVEQRLRIEAFLIPSAGAEKAHAVHVPGYDNLDQGEIQRIDPLGLSLTTEERARLEELIKANDDLARALERVRRGEAKLEDVFAEMGGRLFKGLDQLVDDLAQFDPTLFPARKQELGAALDVFAQAAAEYKAQLSDEARAKWQFDLDKLVDDSPAITTLAVTIKTLTTLRDKWKHPEPANIPALLSESLATLNGLVEAVSVSSQIVKDIKGQIDAWEQFVKDLPADARTKVWDKSTLKALVEEWRDRVVRVETTVTSFVALLTNVKQPVRTNLQNPAAIDLPLGAAKDTRIDLRRTTRKSGDHLQIRARLLKGTTGDVDVEPQFETTFELEKLGWHADLIPSVVFVEGDRVAGANDSGGFSTSLGWMWRYGPRDDEDDPFLSRSLGWSAGLHATFLNFGPDNDAEVGLGITFGLWDQRLQFGIGYNPLADSDRDGRVYYFIGSSLVPLLQALSRDDS